MPDFSALIRSAHTLRPFTPGVFTAKGKAERDREFEEAKRQALAQEGLQRGNLGLGFGRLASTTRGQDLQQSQFEAAQRERLEAEQRKLKNEALRGWAKARLSGDQAAMDVAAQGLKRLGFRVEGAEPQMAPQAPPPPEPVQLKPFSAPPMSRAEGAMAEDVQLEPQAGTGRTPEQEAKAKALPIAGRGIGGAMSVPSSQPKPKGTRIYDDAGNLVWDESDPVVERWYTGRINRAFGGMVDKYKEDPEALAAVLAGYEHASGLMGTGIGADKAAEEGMALATNELDRMGKLERAELVANRPRGSSGADQRKRTAWTQFNQIKKNYERKYKFSLVVDTEKDLMSALNMIREDKRNGVSDRIIAQKVQKSLQGGRLSNYDMQMLFQAGGFSAQVARFWNYMVKGGELPDVFIDQLRTSMVDLLKAAVSRRNEAARGFYEEAKDDILIDVTPEEREAKAREGYKYFSGKEYGAGGGPKKAAKKTVPKGTFSQMIKDAM
jgi:hypothetical protein